MSFLIVLLIIIFLFMIGISVINLFDLTPSYTIKERLPFAYGLGVGLISFQMLIYSLFKIQWTSLGLVLPWMILIFVSIKRKKLLMPKKSFFSFPKGFRNKLLIAGIFLTVIFVIFEALLRPLSAWDGWANWFIGGKAFFLAKGIDINYINYANNSTQPLIHLLLAFSFTMLGKVDDHATLLLFTSFYISLIGMIFIAVRKLFSTRLALLFTFLFATLENVIRHSGRYDVGHADLPLGYIFFSSALLLSLFIKEKSSKVFILYNVFLLIGALTKSEGLAFYAISQIVAIIYLIKEKKWRYFPFLLISLIPLAGWELFNIIFHLPTNPFLTKHINLTRVPLVAFKMSMEFFDINRWNFLWICFIFSFIFLAIRKKLSVITLLCILQLGVYFFIYLSTPIDPAVHIAGSFDRLLLHLTPFAIYTIAFVISLKPKIE